MEAASLKSEKKNIQYCNSVAAVATQTTAKEATEVIIPTIKRRV